MAYLIAAHTDCGNTKQTNQDSYCVLEAATDRGLVLLAVICDGMGGLEKGELASAVVIRALTQWFENDLSHALGRAERNQEIIRSWRRLIREQNQRIGEYGRAHDIELGSTLTAFLAMDDDHYIVGHVGDSRLYIIRDSGYEILTEDQTVVANDVRIGRITPEAALTDPRRNVLLQCIGASRTVEPVFYEGTIEKANYLLCSDGFRHVISGEEIANELAPAKARDEDEMKASVIRLVEENKRRGETDNITAVLIHAE